MCYENFAKRKNVFNFTLSKTTLLGLILIVMFLFCSCNKSTNRNDSKIQESSYDRIMESGVIRCGYVSNPPSCIIDPNTKKVTGIVVEAIELAAKNLNLKIEWTEEVGFSTMIEGINANRYDLVPCAIWPNAARARHVDFSIPLFYSGLGTFVRQNDSRFDNKTMAINSPDVIIATMDGEMAQTIANSDFPKAKTLQIPQLSEITTMLLNVKNNKADVTFVEHFFAAEFLKNNPGSIKNITPNKPIRVFPNTVMLNRGEYKLKSMLNIALEELINLGVIDKLIDKYEPMSGIFYRLKTSYRNIEASR